MFFSPVTARSLRVRLLYLCLYAGLTLLGLTMIIPFLLMLSGSVQPGNYGQGFSLFPSYLYSDKALWERYIYTRYREQNTNLQMSLDNPRADLRNVVLPERAALASTALWEEFRQSSHWPQDPLLTSPGFCAIGANVPSYYGRKFQEWMRERYASIDELNLKLQTTFLSFNRVNPPPVSLVGPEIEVTPLLNEFLTFSRDEVPARDHFVWNAGGYYRAVYLPRTYGTEIGAYNQAFGSNYKSYSEVPFPAEAPDIGREQWHLYVSRLLRPNFISFTPEGEAHWRKSGLKRVEFIRTVSRPEDLKVITLDCQFQQWAEQTHDITNARIPSLTIDEAAFRQDRHRWKWRFLTQNYRFVADEVMLHGTALRNTMILVSLMVVGSLTVNPLAAYALSRFKLRQTYFVLLFFLATIAFPAEVTMIPVFLQLKEFGMLNSFWALVLPTLTNGFSIFLLKGFFDSLPRELYEAAEIDGAGEWRMFWLIAMNLSKPILAVIGLGAFVSAYGAFFYALILAPDPAMWTIMVFVYQLQQNAGSSVIYASLIFTAIPTLLIFIFCQNLILRGIVVPTEK